jgi:hypothetical protein
MAPESTWSRPRRLAKRIRSLRSRRVIALDAGGRLLMISLSTLAAEPH